MTSKIEDIDLNFNDFQSRVNSDLIGKIINIGSRCAKFINKDFDNQLSASVNNDILINECLSVKDEIIENFENRNYSTNIRIISSLSDKINKYLDNEKPWVKIKEDDQKKIVHQICTDGLNLFRILIGYLKPVLPNISKKVEDILLCESITWKNLDQLLLDSEIDKFTSIITRIKDEDIESMKISNRGENNDK